MTLKELLAEVRTIPGIPGIVPATTYRVRSIQSFGYMIENIKNKDDIRRISRKGWEEAELTMKG